jgi:hypothetical protein
MIRADHLPHSPSNPDRKDETPSGGALPAGSTAASPINLHATEALRAAVFSAKMRGRRQYQLARAAGYRDPSQLSQVLIGATRVRPTDERARRLCEQLGIEFAVAFQPDAAAAVDGSIPVLEPRGVASDAAPSTGAGAPDGEAI